STRCQRKYDKRNEVNMKCCRGKLIYVIYAMQSYFAETSDGAIETKKFLPFDILITKLQGTQLPIWPVPAAFPTGTTISIIASLVYRRRLPRPMISVLRFAIRMGICPGILDRSRMGWFVISPMA